MCIRDSSLLCLRIKRRIDIDEIYGLHQRTVRDFLREKPRVVAQKKTSRTIFRFIRDRKRPRTFLRLIRRTVSYTHLLIDIISSKIADIVKTAAVFFIGGLIVEILARIKIIVQVDACLLYTYRCV